MEAKELEVIVEVVPHGFFSPEVVRGRESKSTGRREDEAANTQVRGEGMSPAAEGCGR